AAACAASWLYCWSLSYFAASGRTYLSAIARALAWSSRACSVKTMFCGMARFAGGGGRAEYSRDREAGRAPPASGEQVLRPRRGADLRAQALPALDRGRAREPHAPGRLVAAEALQPAVHEQVALLATERRDAREEDAHGLIARTAAAQARHG